MYKKTLIDRFFSKILFSLLLIVSTSTFSIDMSGLNLTPAQQLQAQTLASQLGVGVEKFTYTNIDMPKFNESIEEKDQSIEYQFSKIELLLNGESVEQSFLKVNALKQFGYDMFDKVPLTFAPVTDAPVPSSYIIGPGDTVNILFFGKESIDF